MLKQILKRSLFAVVPAIQLHNKDTYKDLYRYYTDTNALKRSDILEMFVGFKVEGDKSLESLIPESLSFDQFVVFCELLNTPKRMLQLAFQTLDTNENKMLSKEEMHAISVVDKDMSFKDFQNWTEKLQDTLCLIKFKAHAVNGKIEADNVAKLLMLAKPLPNSIKNHLESLDCEGLNYREFSEIWKLLNEGDKLHDVLAFLGPKNINLELFERAISATSSSSGFTVSTNSTKLLFRLLDVDNSGLLDDKEIIDFFEAKFDARNESKIVHCFKRAKESLEF